MKRKNKLRVFLILFTVAVVAAAALLLRFDNKKIKTAAPTSVKIYDAYGRVLRDVLSPSENYSSPVTLDKVSPWMILALVAAEDKRFFTHSGVDIKAISRAAWQNANAGGVVSGASTITQQLVKAIEPRERTFFSKIKEALTALKLEKTADKYQILEDYLNTAHFSNMTRGVQAAADFYFHADAATLSISQAAFLAAMVKSPVKYNPLKNLDAAVKRRDAVLKKMFDNGFITEEMYELSVSEKPEIYGVKRAFRAPHFTRYVLNRFENPPSEITTTLNLRLQMFLQDLVPLYLEKLADNNVTNAAVVIIENKTGNVLAYLGSQNYFDAADGQVDGIIALRQPGSALKPFIYALAMERGGYTPATLIKDEDTFFKGGFRPRNYDEKFHGLVPLRNALANSYNVPVVRVAEEMGVENILEILRSFGFASLTKDADNYGLGIALGNGEVRLIELAAAYAALANGGRYIPPNFTLAPRLENGAERRVLSPQTAYLVTHILADNNARAAAFGLNSPLTLPFDFAAKTGTSKDYRDNWAVGFTPEWTIAVWAGNFNGEPMRKVSGISGAAPLLKDAAVFMQTLYPSTNFVRPEGIKTAYICAGTELLASELCTHTKEEVFNEKIMPVKYYAGRTGDSPPAAPAGATRIKFPKHGDVFKIDPAVPADSQKILFRAEGEKCGWVLNNQPLPAKDNGWWTLEPGDYKLSCGGETVNFIVLK